MVEKIEFKRRIDQDFALLNDLGQLYLNFFLGGDIKTFKNEQEKLGFVNHKFTMIR